MNNKIITLLEPTWDRHTHLPGNLGLLRITCLAFPEAAINYVGGQAQIDLIKESAPTEIVSRVQFHAWQTGQDKDTLPTNVYRAIKNFKSLPAEIIEHATQLIFCSITASALNAVNLLGLAPKCWSMLHGNANDLHGWRSRNPFRRYFDFRAVLERHCRQGGHVMALEDRIVSNLSEQYPWMRDHLTCLPHPLTPEEAAPHDQVKSLAYPVKIGFAGNASLEKGFAEFIQLASALNETHPGKFEFHAVGRLAKDAEHLDQAPLTRKTAEHALARNDYVEQLGSMHYLFTWHRNSYYGNAASGVVYDAINLGIPLFARDTAQLAFWKKADIEIADAFNDLDSAIQFLRSGIDTEKYQRHLSALTTLREQFSDTNIAKILREHL